MQPMRDVVIIGGGIAGLSAAWRLRDRDVLLIEAADRLGGRMRSDACGEYWLNYGAHLFPAPGTLVDTMARECDLVTVPVTGTMAGLAVRSRMLVNGRLETYPFRLPFSLRNRIAFARAGLKVRRAVARRVPTLDYEDDRTFGEFLGALPAEVEEIFACATHRATADLDELSAGCGIGLFALVWDGKASLIARNLLGGTGRLPEALGRKLAGRISLNTPAHAIESDGKTLLVDGIRTRHVIVAAQAPHAAPLVASVAPGTADALSKITYGAFLSVAIATNERAPMPWDGVYAIATPGRVFDMFTNQAHCLRTGTRHPGGSLMLFAGGRAAAELSRESDEVIAARFLADLHDLYPKSRGIVASAHVHRWELGNAYARPGRARLQPALEGALGAHQNVHLAGDYFAELGNMEAAAQTGLAAAERVDALLRARAAPHA